MSTQSSGASRCAHLRRIPTCARTLRANHVHIGGHSPGKAGRQSDRRGSSENEQIPPAQHASGRNGSAVSAESCAEPLAASADARWASRRRRLVRRY